MVAIRARRLRLGLSQRQLARRAGVAYRTVQLIESGGHDPRWSTLSRLARTLGIAAGELDAAVAGCFAPDEESVEAVSAAIVREGSESWKGRLFEFVDAFRRMPGARLVEAPPATALDRKLKALVASVVESLCEERRMTAPLWCAGIGALDEPWFPADIESLKASALVEAPAQYRRRNIFVLGNFLARA